MLITGGAGFIGSYVCQTLMATGHEVVVLDNRDPQVDGENAVWPAYMPSGIENHVGDVHDRQLVRQFLGRCDAVIHLAAAVGQSMDKTELYCSVSVMGTAILEGLLSDEDQRWRRQTSRERYAQRFCASFGDEAARRTAAAFLEDHGCAT